MIEQTKLERIISGVVLLALLGSCLLMLRPFLSALPWAAVLCFSTWPFYKRLLSLVRGHRTLVAMFMTMAIILVVLLPFVIIPASLSDNVRDVTAVVKGSRRLIEPLSTLLLVIGKMLISGLVALALSILIALFFFRDGQSIAQHLNAIVDRGLHTFRSSVIVVRGSRHYCELTSAGFASYRRGLIGEP